MGLNINPIWNNKIFIFRFNKIYYFIALNWELWAQCELKTTPDFISTFISLFYLLVAALRMMMILYGMMSCLRHLVRGQVYPSRIISSLQPLRLMWIVILLILQYYSYMQRMRNALVILIFLLNRLTASCSSSSVIHHFLCVPHISYRQ